MGNGQINCNKLLLHVQFVGEVGERRVTFNWEKSEDRSILVVATGLK